MNLEQLKKESESFVSAPLGIEFLDDRIEQMRNPQGYVADYYRYFYHFAKRYTPNTIVELGAWQGTSAAHFAAGSPDTLVITVDHHTDKGDIENRRLTELAQAEFKNLTYCHGWTCDTLYAEEKDKHDLTGENAFPKVKTALRGKGIDVLFIDSWHEYGQAKKDWEAYRPLLSDVALVICDDILEGTKGSGIDNMQKFWDEIDADKFLNYNLHKGYPIGFFIWTQRK